MNAVEKIELLAKRNGMSIKIAPANSWVGSKGKGKWAYSQYIKGMGIYEPSKAYKNLKELESAIIEEINRYGIVYRIRGNHERQSRR